MISRRKWSMCRPNTIEKTAWVTRRVTMESPNLRGHERNHKGTSWKSDKACYECHRILSNQAFLWGNVTRNITEQLRSVTSVLISPNPNVKRTINRTAQVAQSLVSPYKFSKAFWSPCSFVPMSELIRMHWDRSHSARPCRRQHFTVQTQLLGHNRNEHQRLALCWFTLSQNKHIR